MVKFIFFYYKHSRQYDSPIFIISLFPRDQLLELFNVGGFPTVKCFVYWWRSSLESTNVTTSIMT
jgi:hypothetical protein